MKFYNTLFKSKWMWSCVCPKRNMAACRLMGDSTIMGLPSHYSICPSQFMYQIKQKFGSRQVCCMSNYSVVSHTQHFVPYAMVCLCSLCNEQSMNYFVQKLTFFFKFNKFQPQKLFLEVLVIWLRSANLI